MQQHAATFPHMVASREAVRPSFHPLPCSHNRQRTSGGEQEEHVQSPHTHHPHTAQPRHGTTRRPRQRPCSRRSSINSPPNLPLFLLLLDLNEEEARGRPRRRQELHRSVQLTHPPFPPHPPHPPQPTDDFPDLAPPISAAELHSLQQGNHPPTHPPTLVVVVVDVRTKEERAVSMLPGAIDKEAFEAKKEEYR